MRKWIGDRKFYRKLLWLSVPIMLQNAITNFVGFLDNIMVGQLGTEQMSGVAIVNQLVFVFNLMIFGGLSGAGIYGAQFYGKRDTKGVRNTFRFKLITGAVVLMFALVVMILWGDDLIRLYLTQGEAGDVAATFRYGKEYLVICLLEFLPFILVQVYASTLRETGQTMVPMLAGVAAVFVNLVFNYLLIFGKFGAPKLGVSGAAIATVLSRFIELGIVVIWTHRNSVKNTFIIGAYRSLRVPKRLVYDILKKGSPLLINEVLWAAGVAIVNQCFSVRGLSVVAGTNIASTIANLFNIVFIAMGSSVAILVGQNLGANEFTKAKETAGKVILFAIVLTACSGFIMFLLADKFPMLYNTDKEVRELATNMIRIIACIMPIQAFLHTAYFTIRSGGKTIITFLFDSCFSWCVVIPVVYGIVHFTGLGILIIYTIYYLTDLIKSFVGFMLLKSGVWVQNIVKEE